jgi:ferric enterobactin receptor
MCTTVFGQSPGTNAKLSGKIKDSVNRSAIDYATISIYKQGSKSPSNGTTSDSKGNFSINNLPYGEYSIKVSFLGFRDFTREHILLSKQQSSATFNNILLNPSSSMLKSVNIAAKTLTVQTKVDKLVYNPSNDLTVQGGTATDVLKKVPMVTVDIDGNVELLGSPGINFLINGKPSSIFGASLTDALQSIPASQIKSIEVITNPGAKYDAQGTGGIINIILKDSNLQGVNGTVNLSAGTRLENGSLNLNARKNNFGVNAFFSGNEQLNTTSINTKTLTNANGIQLLNQAGNNNINRNGYQTGINFDWKLSKTDDLTASLGYDRFSNHTYGLTSLLQTTFDPNGLPRSMAVLPGTPITTYWKTPCNGAWVIKRHLKMKTRN